MRLDGEKKRLNKNMTRPLTISRGDSALDPFQTPHPILMEIPMEEVMVQTIQMIQRIHMMISKVAVGQ